MHAMEQQHVLPAQQQHVAQVPAMGQLPMAQQPMVRQPMDLVAPLQLQPLPSGFAGPTARALAAGVAFAAPRGGGDAAGSQDVGAGASTAMVLDTPDPVSAGPVGGCGSSPVSPPDRQRIANTATASGGPLTPSKTAGTSRRAEQADRAGGQSRRARQARSPDRPTALLDGHRSRSRSHSPQANASDGEGLEASASLLLPMPPLGAAAGPYRAPASAPAPAGAGLTGSQGGGGSGEGTAVGPAAMLLDLPGPTWRSCGLARNINARLREEGEFSSDTRAAAIDNVHATSTSSWTRHQHVAEDGVTVPQHLWQAAVNAATRLQRDADRAAAHYACLPTGPAASSGAVGQGVVGASGAAPPTPYTPPHLRRGSTPTTAHSRRPRQQPGQAARGR